MAENPDNKWSQDRKALSLFKHTDAILFFGTPFRGIHDWFQSELPRLAKTIVPIVRDDVFESFRQDSPILAELRKDFIDKSYWYKKPNVGYIWEMQLSNVGKIIGDNEIPKVRLRCKYIVEESPRLIIRSRSRWFREILRFYRMVRLGESHDL